MNYDHATIKSGVKLILSGMGLNLEDPNFIGTPNRVAKALVEMCGGLYEDYNKHTAFPSEYDGIVFFKQIDAVGICPHHLLPIDYQVTFAYIPTGKVLGLSKIPRIIKNLAARPILQEDLSNDIVNYFEEKLKPLGIALVINGIHGCMKYRGIHQKGGVKTARMMGAFFDKPQARAEFYELMKNGQ